MILGRRIWFFISEFNKQWTNKQWANKQFLAVNFKVIFVSGVIWVVIKFLFQNLRLGPIFSVNDDNMWPVK